MATVLPLAVPAASAAPAPRANAFSSPRPVSFLGTRTRLSLLHPGAPRGVACALRRRPSKYKKKIQAEEEVEAADVGIDADDEDGALEALFKQLEEDLKNDDLSVDDDDISEEDMALFEKELAAAMDDASDVDESTGDSLPSPRDYANVGRIDGSEQPELKTWQLRRLARALKIGRRKTSIKNLAGELGLDRSLVIELLRNPPLKLLLMSDSLPDEVPLKAEVKDVELETSSTTIVDEVDATETKPHMELPIHVMSAEWSARKRLKKVQLETLERVYLRSKRPTNAMISSIVQVTNLPRKTIVKWFEDRREQDGVPDNRAAFKRSLSQTVASS